MSAEAWLIDTPKRRTRSVRLTSPRQKRRSSMKARRRSTDQRREGGETGGAGTLAPLACADAIFALDSRPEVHLVFETMQLLRRSTFWRSYPSRFADLKK